MKTLVQCIGLLIALILSASVCQAQEPRLAVSTSYNGGKPTDATYSFTITPNKDASACKYMIYGSTKKRKLKRAPQSQTVLYTLNGSDSDITFTGTAYRAVLKSSVKRKAKMHFRVLENCGGNVLNSNLVSKRLRKSSSSSFPALKDYANKLAALFLTDKADFEGVFPNLTTVPSASFARVAPDDSGRIFFATYSGDILVLDGSDPEATSTETFLNMSGLIPFLSRGDSSIQSLAFHPDFKTNGKFYISYIAAEDLNLHVSEFSLSEEDPAVADTESERIIFEIESAQELIDQSEGKSVQTKYSADIVFGADGYLYITLADGGIDANGQDTTNLYGTIMRIDVDNTSGDKNYAIPPTNPFVGNTESIREEIYAYGFETPFNLAVNFEDGTLWATDARELNIIESGKNYGWDIMVAGRCNNPKRKCGKKSYERPVLSFYATDREADETLVPQQMFFYDGDLYPELKGKLMYDPSSSDNYGIGIYLPGVNEAANYVVKDALITHEKPNIIWQGADSKIYTIYTTIDVENGYERTTRIVKMEPKER